MTATQVSQGIIFCVLLKSFLFISPDVNTPSAVYKHFNAILKEMSTFPTDMHQQF